MPAAGHSAPAALLDDHDVARLAAALAQHAGVLERGDRAVRGERALVAAGELAGVQRDGDQLALRAPHLDAAPDQVRVQRVVVGVEPDVRIGRHAQHPAAVDVGLACG
jgi:hypothetical protein